MQERGFNIFNKDNSDKKSFSQQYEQFSQKAKVASWVYKIAQPDTSKKHFNMMSWSHIFRTLLTSAVE